MCYLLVSVLGGIALLHHQSKRKANRVQYLFIKTVCFFIKHNAPYFRHNWPLYNIHTQHKQRFITMFKVTFLFPLAVVAGFGYLVVMPKLAQIGASLSVLP